MSHFTYKAKKSGGEIYSGERDAADRYELFKLVRDSGEEVVQFHEGGKKKGLKLRMSLSSISNSVKMVDKINFARNLGAMLEAGLALSRALSVLERQTGSKSLKKVITSLIDEINRGTSLSESLTKQEKVFSPLFISMVGAGEQSGTLAESLKVVAAQMDSNYTLEKRIRGALIYPGVIIGAMIVIGILMFIFVIPVLLKTFIELNVQLPLSTRIVLWLSNTVHDQGILILLILLIVTGVLYWWGKKPAGKSFIDNFLLKIPVIGVLVQEVNTARTARTLSSLLSSGVDVIQAMSITANVVQNVHFRAVLEKAVVAIKKGELMSTVFEEETNLFPIFFAEMVSVGEETGKTGEMLLGVANYYEAEVDQKTKNMSTIIEPVLILTIGAAVGIFAVSMIQPIYSLVGAIK